MTPGSPHPKMWDRLNEIYGEERSVAVAIEISRRNAEGRKVPLTEQKASTK